MSTTLCFIEMISISLEARDIGFFHLKGRRVWRRASANSKIKTFLGEGRGKKGIRKGLCFKKKEMKQWKRNQKKGIPPLERSRTSTFFDWRTNPTH